MCGIAGKINFLTPPSRAAVERMTARLFHRGPDNGAVIQCNPHVIVGHRRLSIIDLSSDANQPMIDSTGRFTIVYNGEIYNYKELREELIRSGFTFKTSSDTEVVLNSYIHWGESCFVKFSGMFALAIWDEQQKELICGRDRFGKKPFYYTYIGNEFTFASELHALLEDERIRDTVTISIEALNQYLALGYILSPVTIFREVHKLEPSTFFKVNEKGIFKQTRFWDYTTCFEPCFEKTEQEYSSEIRNRLKSAVQYRLNADVPVGVLLSGGIDSSAITCMASEIHSQKLHSFSIGFDESSYDESTDARFTADFAGTIHHDHKITAPDRKTLIDTAIRIYDEPFADTSAIPTYAVSKHASSLVKVVLSGDGADEIFGGYITYNADLLRKKLAWTGALRKLPVLLSPLLPGTTRKRKLPLNFKIKQFVRGLPLDYKRAHYTWREIFTEQERITILGDSAKEEICDTDPFKIFERHYSEVEELDMISQHLYVDVKTWLADDILVKVDRASMACSLEVRCPFLDNTLVEYVAGIPSHLKIKNGSNKYILKKALEGIVPERTRKKKKSGFGAPVSTWLQTSTLEDQYRKFIRYTGKLRGLPIKL
ncbi:MAG: asparagine synthase (glutamine-hydrolyzing) [Fibrobacter sp.]|nr:asparagine synthase (glutamine-hydrolyzing) [Fibrobacter sp.]